MIMFSNNDIYVCVCVCKVKLLSCVGELKSYGKKIVYLFKLLTYLVNQVNSIEGQLGTLHFVHLTT